MIRSFVTCCLLFLLTAPAAAQQLRFENAVVVPAGDVAVPAQDSAQLLKLRIKPGQQVKKGDVIAMLDSRQLEAERAVIEAELRIAEQAANSEVNIQYARKSTDVARRVLQRSNEANSIVSRSVSATEIDRLKLEAERSELSIEQATIEMESARMQLDLQQRRLDAIDQQILNRTIFSPIDGVVAEISVEPGEWAQIGETVARVVQFDRVEIQALAAGDSIDASFQGKAITVYAQLPVSNEQVELTGVLTFVSPEITPATGLLQITAEVDNSERKLRPGQQVSLEIGE